MTAVDLLHIPTPWHNCVVKLGDRLVVTKSKTARNAVASGNLAGGLVQGRPGEDSGACFELWDPVSTTRAACKNDVKDRPAQVEVKMTTAKVVEAETIVCQVVDSDNDGVSGHSITVASPQSSWLRWLRRLTTWWVWSRSSAYALANNPYHQHKSQGLGA